MANLTKQYLDYDGLVVFLNNLKEYIADRISEINGSNVNAYDKDEDNPLHTTDPNGYKTIAEQLQALWEAIGVGGDGNLSITEKIENIIGEYVKAINTPTSQTLPLQLKIEEGAGDNKDRFTISLVDNGLADKLDTLTTNRVSKLEVGDDGGAATLSIDKSTGNVKITINSKALTERVETLELHDGKYDGNASNDDWNYVLGGKSNSSGGWQDIKHSTILISPQGKYSDQHTVLAPYGGLAIGTDVFGGHGITMGVDASSGDYLQIGPDHITGGISIGTEMINIGSSTDGSGGVGGIKIGTEIRMGNSSTTGGIFINPSAINIGNSATLGGIDISSYGIEVGNYYSTGGILINSNGVDIESNQNISIGSYSPIRGITIGTEEISVGTACRGGITIGTEKISIGTGSSAGGINIDSDKISIGGVKFTGDGEMEGSLTGDVTGTASNATNLNNQPATYYAKQSDMTDITERVEAIESDWIKDIAVSVTSKTTTPKYITLEESDNNGDSTITLSEVALVEKFEAVDNSVTTNTTNIANETTARENADTALDERLTDVEDVQSNLASQIQALSLGMKVAGSASPSTFFKGNTHSVTVTATVQNMPSGFEIEEIKMGNTNAIISSNKGTITESVKLSGTTNSKSWSISAKVSGIPFTSSASVNARYPIFYGMDENNNGLPKSLPTTIDYSKMNIGSYSSNSSITGCNLKRDKYRTSARGYSYEKISNSTATPMNFFVLVPSDVSLPTGFTMGGAPFVMDTVKTSTYTIDGFGVTYYIYKSGGTYLNGGSVTLGLS